MDELGEYLKKLRGKMTLMEAAERIGLSHAYIRDLELGKKKNPSMKALKKIAEAYNVPFDELVGKAYIKVHVGFAEDLEKEFGIKIQKQNEEKKPALFAGDDILFNLKSNPNVSLNFKPLKEEDKQRMEDLLKAAFPEYFK